MEVKCDRCGSATTPKQIKRKTDGQIFTVYLCNGSCMNGKYKYSCFPPKEPKTDTNGSLVLTEISDTLKRIEKILANPKSVHVTQEELRADEPDIFE